MANTVDHHRLNPGAIGRELELLGLSPWDFAALWGVNRQTIQRWLLHEDHPRALEPPYWLTVALDLMHLPGAPERVLLLHDQNKVSNDGHET